MIKITNIEVTGWESAIRGMRNPMNSWDRSDSGWCYKIKPTCAECERFIDCNIDEWEYIVGENDLILMKNLAKSGTDHSKYRRFIVVTVDVLAPLYWWKEADTYKVGTVANSCSTMHKVHSKEFDFDDFSTDHLEDFSWNRLDDLIGHLNRCRECYVKTKDKSYWWQIIQLLPSSYNQLRTLQLNYEVLANMYKSRKNHKLDEWRDFCDWIESLPYSELITGDE